MTKSRSCVVRGIPQALLAIEPVSMYLRPLKLRRRTQSRSNSCSVTGFAPVPAGRAAILQLAPAWPPDAVGECPVETSRRPTRAVAVPERRALRASWHGNGPVELPAPLAVSYNRT